MFCAVFDWSDQETNNSFSQVAKIVGHKGGKCKTLTEKDLKNYSSPLVCSHYFVRLALCVFFNEY